MMRLLWYTGASAALAATVVLSAFTQRANFYSAMVYLFQSNICLIILVNLTILVYSSFMYGLQRICFGQLRAIEVEQLYERAWFAVTELCLAMTIFRDEIGGFFLVMFMFLLTGKVWGWIGEGRVEALEQQPPDNPYLFHLRLTLSLVVSLAYNAWMLCYAIDTVLWQAQANMMVMFLFEFAILVVASLHTILHYVIVWQDAYITRRQVRERLQQRRQQVREEREAILRRRAEGEEDDGEPLPDEEDVDEMDIEVAGWEAKGQYILCLDLMTDSVKLCIYATFFVVLYQFYGLPLHIIRDLFLTMRSFVKRLGALTKYRQAIRDMNRYADATAEDLQQENTCIICREDMHPWDGGDNTRVERTRPKKLPCGHILHLGCLKSWMERQQVCPTCRRSVVIADGAPQGLANGDAGLGLQGLNLNAGPGAQQQGNGAAPQPGGQAPADGPGGDAHHNNGFPPPVAHIGGGGPARGVVRMFHLGPIRLGFAQGGAQDIQQLAQRLGMPLVPQDAAAGAGAGAGAAPRANPGPAQAPAATQPTPTPTSQPTQATGTTGMGDNVPTATYLSTASTSLSPDSIFADLEAIERRIDHAMVAYQLAGLEIENLRLMAAEMHRLRESRRQLSTTLAASASATSSTSNPTDAAVPGPLADSVSAPLDVSAGHSTPTVSAPGASAPSSSSQSSQPLPQTQPQPPALGSTRSTLSQFTQLRGAAVPTAAMHLTTAEPGSSSVIPAGSPDLPHGVQLPPGWSLIPLERVDSTLAGPPASALLPVTQETTGGNLSSVPSASVQQSTPSRSTDATVSSSSSPAPPRPSEPTPTVSLQSTEAAATVASAATPPPAEASPERAAGGTTITWGGPAQFFGGSSSGGDDNSNSNRNSNSNGNVARSSSLSARVEGQDEADAQEWSEGSSSSNSSDSGS